MEYRIAGEIERNYFVIMRSLDGVVEEMIYRNAATGASRHREAPFVVEQRATTDDPKAWVATPASLIEETRLRLYQERMDRFKSISR